MKASPVCYKPVRALEMDACKIINIKPGRVGGFEPGRPDPRPVSGEGCAGLVRAGMLETGVGRASNLALASLPGFTMPGDISASDRYYVEDITRERFVLDPGSTIDVPAGPGLGVTIDQAALKKFSLAELRLTVK